MSADTGAKKMPAQLRQNDTGPKSIRQSAATIKCSYGNPAYLETPEDVTHFINTALEDGDPIVVKHAIGTAARSKGMATIAEEAGLNRTSLYRAFEDDGNPLFFNVLKVLSSLGFSLQVVPATTTTHKNRNY